MKLRIVFSAFVILFLLLEACSPKTAAAPTPAGAQPPAATASDTAAPAPQPAVSVPAPVVIPPTSPPAVAPAPPASVRPFDESLLRGREFLLEAASAPQFVQDPDLGTLGRVPAVSRTIEGFFLDARDGKLDAETLVPRWAGYLQGWAKRYQLSGNGEGKSVRVGEGMPGEEGLLLVPVRLVGGAKAPLQGWVALAGSGEAWLVSDVQVVEAAAGTGPYDPESPSQEISSPSLR